MKLSKVFTFGLVIFSTFIFSQDNTFLKPTDHPLFSNINNDYYYLLRSVLLKKDFPTLALLKTSHKPESILYVTYDTNNFKYYLNFKITQKSLWEKYYNQSKEDIKITSFKKEIDNSSYEILKELFDSNLYKTRYDSNYKEYFDGEQFLFFSDRKTGSIESVSKSSNVFKTIKICEKIIELLQNDNNNKLTFSSDLQTEIKEIIINNK